MHRSCLVLSTSGHGGVISTTIFFAQIVANTLGNSNLKFFSKRLVQTILTAHFRLAPPKPVVCLAMIQHQAIAPELSCAVLVRHSSGCVRAPKHVYIHMQPTATL